MSRVFLEFDHNGNFVCIHIPERERLKIHSKYFLTTLDMISDTPRGKILKSLLLRNKLRGSASK